MTGFRLLLFDMDGTLLDSEQRIRDDARAALSELMRQGVLVGLATGRSVVSVAPFVEQLAPNGPLILLNGGMLWCSQRRREVAAEYLTMRDALAALDVAEALGVHCNLYLGEHLYVAEHGSLSRQSEQKDGVPHTPVGRLSAFLRRQTELPFKILLIEPSGEVDHLQGRLRRIVPSCTVVNSEPTYVEVLPAGVCKGSCLARVEEHFGIAAGEVIAFGDGLNDLELLRDAGLGVAMGNAHPQLAAVSDRVIGDHGGDAIARFLAGLRVSQGRVFLPPSH